MKVSTVTGGVEALRTLSLHLAIRAGELVTATDGMEALRPQREAVADVLPKLSNAIRDVSLDDRGSLCRALKFYRDQWHSISELSTDLEPTELLLSDAGAIAEEALSARPQLEGVEELVERLRRAANDADTMVSGIVAIAQRSGVDVTAIIGPIQGRSVFDGSPAIREAADKLEALARLGGVGDE